MMKFMKIHWRLDKTEWLPYVKMTYSQQLSKMIEIYWGWKI